MAVTKKQSIQRSFDWTPILAWVFFILGAAATLVAMPGVILAWVGALISAWGKRPPMLTGKKDARQSPSAASPYEEKLLAKYQAAKTRRLALWGLSKSVLPMAARYERSDADWQAVGGIDRLVDALSAIRKPLGVAAKPAAAAAKMGALVRLDWLSSVALGVVAATLPMSVVLPGWARIVAFAVTFVWAVTGLSARRQATDPAYPPPCVTAPAAHAHVLSWVLAKKDHRGWLAIAPAAAAAAGWFGYGFAVTFIPLYPVVASNFDSWGQVGVATAAYMSVLGAVTRREIRESWLLAKQANAEWAPRFEDTKATPRAATVVSRQILTVNGGEGEFGVTVDTMRAPGDDRAAIMRAASSLNAHLPEGVRLYALPLGAHDQSGVGDKAGFRFVSWPEDASFSVESAGNAAKFDNGRGLSAGAAIALRFDMALAELGLVDAWVTEVERLTPESESAASGKGDLCEQDDGYGPVGADDDFTEPAVPDYSYDGRDDDDDDLEDQSEPGASAETRPGWVRAVTSILGSLRRLGARRGAKKSTRGGAASTDDARLPGAYRITVNSPEHLASLAQGMDQALQGFFQCDVLVSAKPPIEGVLVGAIDDPFAEESPVSAGDLYAVRQAAWWERVWNSALRKDGQNPIWQPAVEATLELASGGEIRFDAFMGRLASTSDQYFGLEAKLLSALDIASFAHVGPYVEDYNPRDGRIQAHDKAVYVAWMPKATSTGNVNKVPSSPAYVRPVDDPAGGPRNHLAPHRPRPPRRDINQGPGLLLAGMVTAAFLGAGLRPPIVRRPSIRLLTNFRAPAGSHVWAIDVQLGHDTFDVVQRALPKLRRTLACDWVRLREEPGGVTVFAGARPSPSHMSDESFEECARLDWAENWVTAGVVGVDGQVPELIRTEPVPDNELVTRFSFTLPRTLTFQSVKEKREKIASASGYGYVEFEVDSRTPAEFTMSVAPHDPMPRAVAMREDLMVGGGDAPLGVAFDGRVLDYNFDRDIHVLCLGKTGAGKSAGIQQFVTALLLRGWSVVVIDPSKGGTDFVYANDYLAAPIAGTLQSADAVMKAVYAEVARRKNINREYGVGSINDLPDEAKYPRLMVVIDEFTSLMSSERLGPRPAGVAEGIAFDRAKNEVATRERIGGLAGRVAREARSVGVALFLGTQVLKADTLKLIRGGGDLKTNMSRLLLGAPTLGEMSSGLRRFEERPTMKGQTRDKGRGIWEDGIHAPMDMQMFFATQDVMGELLERQGVKRVLELDVEQFMPEDVEEPEDVIDNETGLLLVSEQVAEVDFSDFDLDFDGIDDEGDGSARAPIGDELAGDEQSASEPSDEPGATSTPGDDSPMLPPGLADALNAVDDLPFASELDEEGEDISDLLSRAEEWDGDSEPDDETGDALVVSEALSVDIDEDWGDLGEDTFDAPHVAGERAHAVETDDATPGEGSDGAWLDDDWGDDTWVTHEAPPGTTLGLPPAAAVVETTRGPGWMADTATPNPTPVFRASLGAIETPASAAPGTPTRSEPAPVFRASLGVIDTP